MFSSAPFRREISTAITSQSPSPLGVPTVTHRRKGRQIVVVLLVGIGLGDLGAYPNALAISIIHPLALDLLDCLNCEEDHFIDGLHGSALLLLLHFGFRGHFFKLLFCSPYFLCLPRFVPLKQPLVAWGGDRRHDCRHAPPKRIQTIRHIYLMLLLQPPRHQM